MMPAGFQRYFTNTSWMLAERAFRLIVNFAVWVWVARYLGPEDFGQLNYATSFVGLFGILLSLGIDSLVVRDLVNAPGDEGEILGTAFGLRAAGAVLLLAGVATGMAFSDADGQTRLLIFLVATGWIFQVCNVVDYFFQAYVLSKYVAVVQFLQVAVSSLVKIALMLADAPLIAFGGVVVLEFALLGIGLLITYKRKRAVAANGLAAPAWRFSRVRATELLRHSWPLILSGMAIMIYVRIDQVMIKSMVNDAAVGYYAAASRITEAWYFFPLVVTNSLFPAIMAARERGPEAYHRRLARLFDLVGWGSLCAAVAVTALAPFIAAVYGEKYVATAAILQIHFWAAVFNAFALTASKYFVLENLQRYALYRNLVGVVVNIAANWLLIRAYGPIGAAWATLLSLVVAYYLAYALFKPTRPLFRMITGTFLFGPVRLLRAAKNREF